MSALRDLLLRSEPLLLFLVIGLGYLVGQIRIRGFGLGIAGVLFVGLFFGGWRTENSEPFKIAPQVTEIGLILFVYAVGLTTGPGFFDSLKSRGLRFNVAVVGSLVLGAAATLVLGRTLSLSVGQISGVYCGGLTNTPALAAATELMHRSGIGDPNDPAVGYSMAYPYGVVGGLLAFQLFIAIYRKAFDKERAESEARLKAASRLVTGNFEIRNPALYGKPIGELRVQDEIGVIISRHRHAGKVGIPTKYTILNEGDAVVVVGSEAKVKAAVGYFGAESKDHLEWIRESITMRRILVSRKALAGCTIESLELDRRFNAQVTRLRRADIDMVPTQDTVLELGDRLRVVMPSDKSADVAKYFGDSERQISELDYTALTLGISAGVLIGMIPIPVPGGTSVSLGFAGGPLIAGLILGKLGRTGPIVWSIPLEANHALRHIGLLFFLAGVGVTAGNRFFQTLSTTGWQLVLLGVVATTLTTALTLFLLRHFGRGTIISAIGATSGMQTQPATLARAYELSGSDETYVAYATTYPVAMVGKILIAQLLILIGNMMG